MQSRTRTTRIHRMFAAFAAAILAIGGLVATTVAPAQAAGEQAVIGMPFTGKWAWNVPATSPWNDDVLDSHPASHSPYGFHWATDLYASTASAPVQVNGYSPQGTVTFQRVSTSDTCSSYGSGIAGQGATFTVFVNGNQVGQVKYDHLDLANVGTGVLASGTTIGTVTSEPLHSTCFQARHAHVQFKNTQGNYSCYVDKGQPGAATFLEGEPLGVLGSNNTVAPQPCTSVPTSSNSSLTASSSNVSTIAGNWSGDSSQDFMYITPRSDGGSDFAVWESTPTGIAWRGSWASASNIGFSVAQFIPNDLDGDGLLDLLYVTPRSGGGFDLSLLHNTGTNFSWSGILWSPTNLSMSAIKFLPGNWTGDSKGDLAYVTPKSGGGFDLAVLESTGTGLNWHGLWWSEPNLAYNTTRFVPVDTDGDGLLDILYSTPRPGTIGFDMSQVRNTGSGVTWVRLEWGEPNLDYNKIRFIPGYWASTTRQGIAYVTPKSGGGFDVSVMNMTTNGMAWAGLWWSQSTLAFDTTAFVPADNNGDGDTDLFYASPRSGGGFDLALNQNANNTFMFVGQQWNPTNLSLGSTKFLPQF